MTSIWIALLGVDRAGARRAAGMIEHDDYSELEIIFCGGGAKIDDMHLLSGIVAVDDQIFAWLKRRERDVEESGTPPRRRID